MLQASVIASGNLPMVTVQEVKNKTSEYIDTRSITESSAPSCRRAAGCASRSTPPGMTQQVEELKRQQSELYAKEAPSRRARWSARSTAWKATSPPS